MKVKFTLIFILCTLMYITLSSKKFGAGAISNAEVCGTPGGGGTCMNCHLGGTFNPRTSVTIKNSAGTTVTTVQGDSVYDVSLSKLGNWATNTYIFEWTCLCRT